jgi:hypothetical protein
MKSNAEACGLFDRRPDDPIHQHDRQSGLCYLQSVASASTVSSCGRNNSTLKAPGFNPGRRITVRTKVSRDSQFTQKIQAQNAKLANDSAFVRQLKILGSLHIPVRRSNWWNPCNMCMNVFVCMYVCTYGLCI